MSKGSSMLGAAWRNALRILGWLISLPVTAAVLLFVIDNHSPVDLSFWPLAQHLSAPVWLLALAVFAAGFLVGGIATWLSTLQYRRAAYKHAREAAALRAHLDEVSRKTMSALYSQQDGAAAARERTLALTA